MITTDLADVDRVQRESYLPELCESEAALLSKIALFPAGAIGCFAGRTLCGYVFALPWKAGDMLQVSQVIDGLPAEPDTMWIHDLVVAPACRGQRVASLLLDEIFRLGAALALPHFSLVAVQQAEPFWQRAGFQPAEPIAYAGTPATKMVCTRPARPRT